MLEAVTVVGRDAHVGVEVEPLDGGAPAAGDGRIEGVCPAAGPEGFPNQPLRTPPEIEARVLKVRQERQYGSLGSCLFMRRYSDCPSPSRRSSSSTSSRPRQIVISYSISSNYSDFCYFATD